MMKVIFECETEIGKCDCDMLPTGSDELRAEYATVFARTQASVNGEKGMLKIEQHCYLQHGTDVPEQPWIRPEILLEPTLASRATMISFAKSVHERFVQRVRTQFPEQLLR